MDIQKQPSGDRLELRLKGRLDAYWSDHLDKALDDAIRAGSHKIDLDLAEVDYLSSAGIRVLLKYYKQLKGIKGALTVIRPSESAQQILDMAGFAELLISTSAAPLAAPKIAEARRVETENAVLYIHDLSAGANMECELLGDPTKLEKGGFSESDCQSISFPESTFGVGLGALGSDFNDCKERFGEFLAVGGVAAYLPTDDTKVPDFMLSEGALVPEMKLLYGVNGHGQFSYMARFDAKPVPPGTVILSELVDACSKFCNNQNVAMVIISETGGLVGAALRKSVISSSTDGSPLNFPAVRDWLSFTTERAFEQTVSVVVGIASRQGSAEVKTFLRPIDKNNTLNGHFHAAVFPYRPLQKGMLDLNKTVNGLFSGEAIQGLLHLVNDDRDPNGAGESEFVRGAIWFAPIGVIRKQ